MENMDIPKVPIIQNENERTSIFSDKSIEESYESSDDDKKCSFIDHNDKDAINYCFKCKVSLCGKCVEFHKKLFANHRLVPLNEKSKETFIGLCKEKNHNIKLEYYCKTHNKLCCGLCICKIKGNGKGQHNECDICLIKDIKEEKINILKDNIKLLKQLSDEIEQSIKKKEEEIKNKKDKLNSEINQIFDKITTELNTKENILSSEVDTFFDENYCIDKKNDEIQSLLEKVESMDDDWEDDDKLKEYIYNCINIENNLKDINRIKEKMNKYYQKEEFNIKFISDVDNFFPQIKKIGYISDSLILKDYDVIKKLSDLMGDDIIIDNMDLLFRSSRDGFNYLNIINAINNKSNLIFLYLTENDKIFGAYIETKLENMDTNGEKKYYKDENAFVFSINNNKKYKILMPEYAIAFDNKNYILIGNNDNNNNGFYYSDNIINDKQLINGEKIYDFSKNSELTGDNGKLIELEIFEIS